MHAARPRPGSLFVSAAHLLHPLHVCLVGFCRDQRAGHMACLVFAVVETAGSSMLVCANDGSVDLGPVGEALPRKLHPQFELLQFEIQALLGIKDHVVGRLLAPLLLLI